MHGNHGGKDNCGLAVADFAFYASLDENRLAVLLEPEESRNGNEVLSPELTEKTAAASESSSFGSRYWKTDKIFDGEYVRE